jgi:uncharacterized protein
MRFVLLVVAVVVLLWLVRGALRRRMPPPEKPTHESKSPAAVSSPEPIVSCAHCGLHLPRDEALPGRGGVFCDDAHRKAYEQAHPGA